MSHSSVGLGFWGLLVLLSAVMLVHVDGNPVKAAAPPAVSVSQPVERVVVDYEDFSGRIEAAQSVEIQVRISGYLTKINFQAGTEVKQGEVLFEIDDRPYKAELDMAKGRAEQWKAALVKAQADLDSALDVQKNVPGAISRHEVSKRQAARDEAAAALKEAQAAEQRARLSFDWTKVKAPISGRVGRPLLSVGNLVIQDQTTLTTLVSTGPMFAYFALDERTTLRMMKTIREGKVKSVQEANFPVWLGLVNEEGFPHRGVIDFVNNQVDPKTSTLQVRAVFPNKEQLLLPGLSARVRLALAAPRKVLLVTPRAVGTDQGKRYVLVVNAKNEVEYRAVEVGQMHDGLQVIEVGLKPGDRIIVEGLQRVQPGMTVDPKEVGMPIQP
jgi:RND family efflux transporter MFP subunit